VSKLSFHGAAGTVTGSCFLLDSGTSKILIDCGLFQGSPALEAQNHAEFGFNAPDIHGMLLTHAHLDHCGRIGKLVREGFQGPIYMTAATHDLLEIALQDAAKVMFEHDGVNAIYGEEDVEKALSLTKIITIDTPFEYGGYKITYINAGHILGSASIILERDGKKIVFSGDLGNSPEDLIQPTEYVNSADTVVMESTYGDRNHPNEDPNLILQQEINAAETSGSTLLIPAFSLERTQELLHRIDHLKKSGKVKTETLVYLDSPMAIKATEVFRKFTELYNQELTSHNKTDDPFSFPGLNVIYKGKDSASLSETIGTQVIIAGSGMMTGGRILNHAITFLPKTTTRVLIVGFQGENTVGRQLVEGAKAVNIYGEQVQVKAHIAESHAMSSHADQTGLLKWFNKINNAKKVILIHGEDAPREALKSEILKTHNQLTIEMPHIQETLEV
jgi:metallo-beta-lactamase family protein